MGNGLTLATFLMADAKIYAVGGSSEDKKNVTDLF